MIRALRLLRSIWIHPANASHRPRALARSIFWQIRKRMPEAVWDIPFHSAKLRCYPDSPSSSGAIYFSGLPDWWEMQFLRRYLRPGDRFIDVGANVGLYTILAADCVGPGGGVDAFEPDERSALRIEEQAALNGFAHVRAHRLAVHEKSETLDFGFSASDAMAHVRRPGESGAAARVVQAVALDDFAAYGSYAAGKMDIEGAEPAALAGAARRLAEANPPVWLLELAGYSRHYGVESHEVVASLRDAGFDCAVYHPDSRTLQYTDRPWELRAQNVLAIARARRAFVEDRVSGSRPTHDENA